MFFVSHFVRCSFENFLDYIDPKDFYVKRSNFINDIVPPESTFICIISINILSKWFYLSNKVSEHFNKIESLSLIDF